MNTPWGKFQYKEKITRGINFYSTASHGGFKVSKKLNEQVPEALRNEDGWYEEDCDSARVYIAFPQFFPADRVLMAMESLKRWDWMAYEKHFGVTLQKGESVGKDEAMFLYENKDKFKAYAAWGDWHKNVPAGMVGLLVEKNVMKPNAEKKYILVPAEEYAKRSETYGHFVVEKEYPEFNIGE